MTNKELTEALRRLSVETGSLVCLGCGYKHNCSTRGCAVIRAAVDALRPQETEWISVTDRLPDRFVPVIVCRADGKVEQGHRDVGGWWKVYGTRTKRVTYWRPLPEPPRNEGTM